jgi:hypothetical protein
MVDNTGLAGLCHVADQEGNMLKLIQQKFEEEITKEEIDHRKKILETQFSNTYNATKIYDII